ncbi:Phosphate transporter PHO1 [Acorus gramineus]|uniref:Phosphate transporter PHO1 n=1 Tax=Acorus gramineus TaxID=55184 RepID=A0AAV8ZYG0_ACOGR|nr:Phosphate transporter PHO1 [Acorus gramineus]
MGFHIMYAEHPTHMWFGIVLITSTFATICQLYWDYVEDWGLLNLKSNNKWLRDELILKNKNFYYISIVINFLLRLTWIYTLLNLKRLSDFNHHLIELLLALLEIIRRGIWHFYRMENEYLNNVGKFRPVKTVPIPY